MSQPQITNTSKITYGCVEDQDGVFTPYIGTGFFINGVEVDFKCNLKFKCMDEARRFVMETHKNLSSPEAQKFNYDYNGGLHDVVIPDTPKNGYSS